MQDEPDCRGRECEGDRGNGDSDHGTLVLWESEEGRRDGFGEREHLQRAMEGGREGVVSIESSQCLDLG